MSLRQIRHELPLPEATSRRLAAMAKAQKRSKSDLLAEMVDTYLNRRSGSQPDDRINAKLDRIIRVVTKSNTECIAISYCLSRFIRHQLIYAAALPPPGKDAIAFGEKRYQEFLDTVARLVARDTNPVQQPPTETSE
jgi:predicted transcriptional regulator